MVVVQWIGTAPQMVAFKYSTFGLSKTTYNDVFKKDLLWGRCRWADFCDCCDVIVMLAASNKSNSATLAQHLEPNEKEITHRNFQKNIMKINVHINKEFEPKMCKQSEDSLENLLRPPFQLDVLLGIRKTTTSPLPPHHLISTCQLKQLLVKVHLLICWTRYYLFTDTPPFFALIGTKLTFSCKFIMSNNTFFFVTKESSFRFFKFKHNHFANIFLDASWRLFKKARNQEIVWQFRCVFAREEVIGGGNDRILPFFACRTSRIKRCEHLSKGSLWLF